MKVSVLIFMLGMFLGLPGFAEEESHHHDSPSVEKNSDPALAGDKADKKSADSDENDKRFAVDAELKTRMEAILGTMRGLHKKRVGEARKKQIMGAGNKVEMIVQDIFKSCKLAPAADEALHPILAEVLRGAALLKKGQEQDGHEKIHQALLKYEEKFKHPGWKHD